jgi:hypothetical protein
MTVKKQITYMLLPLLLCLGARCTEDRASTAGCTVDTSKTGYELAKGYDDCLIEEAQKITAHIDPAEIEIRTTETTLTIFSSTYALLDAESGWVQAFYAFLPEEMSAYPDAPPIIDGVVITKMKSKASVDQAFGRTNDLTQGLCVDVQEVVYDRVLQSILTAVEREKYESEGTKLSFIPDDDVPPLGPDTNPVDMGQFWHPVDPASKVTSDANGYYYEPASLLFDIDHPNAASVDDGLVGVRYCKLLTHQAILNWMRSKSFESEPVLVTPAEDRPCTQPQTLQNTAGSCLFYFPLPQVYYCSDYVGVDHDTASAQEICSQTSRQNSVYDSKSCSERTDEIIDYIPEYEGLRGACIVRCGQGDEFLWNSYVGNLAENCEGYTYFTAEQLAEFAAAE